MTYVAALYGFAFGVAVLGPVAFILHERKARNAHRSTAGNRDDSDFEAQLASLVAAERGAGTREAAGAAAHPGVEETTSDVPLLGYKRVALNWAPGGAFWLGNNRERSFAGSVQLEANAVCLHQYEVYLMTPPERHDAPKLDCTCGFYAVRNPDDLSVGYGSVRLDVELSGRVIVHERGYRAQHQRVLRAHTPGCWFCGDESTVVWLAEVDEPKSHWESGRGLYDHGRTVTTTVKTTQVRPLCAAHQFKADGEVSVPVAQVMRALALPSGGMND